MLARAAEEAKSDGKFLVVYMHKPLYSGGNHIDDMDTIAIRKFYAPLFDRLGVDLVVAGHDHVYTRSMVDGNGNRSDNAPLYITAGHAGSLKWYIGTDYEVEDKDPILPNYEFLDFNSNDYEWRTNPIYCELVIEGNSMTINAYRIENNESILFDSYSLSK